MTEGGEERPESFYGFMKRVVLELRRATLEEDVPNINTTEMQFAMRGLIDREDREGLRVFFKAFSDFGVVAYRRESGIPPEEARELAFESFSTIAAHLDSTDPKKGMGTGRYTNFVAQAIVDYRPRNNS